MELLDYRVHGVFLLFCCLGGNLRKARESDPPSSSKSLKLETRSWKQARCPASSFRLPASSSNAS
ncbi:hypothetical protein SZ55_5206 [Pseudomonas sp. FeS53a]|nr:hypothetical protein SZ55_5206 [Pseudomonas sp. FeS53a]